MTYRITKTYDHNQGLSACFRQWRAESHCRFLHGYALAFKFTFEADTLDANNWVLDFGSLKPLKAWLVENFDHRLLVAKDDPAREHLEELGQLVWSTPPESDVGYRPGHEQLADVLLVDAVGCEAFAKMAYDAALELVMASPHPHHVRLIEVEVREHSANSAIYMGEAR